MKEFFRELSKESGALHRVMATVLENGVRSKTLIYGYDIMYCSGDKKFFLKNLEEIVDVRMTGVYEIGGKEVYCEVLEDLPELVVCGAGHVGAACIRAASYLDMHITCIEDREDYAQTAREAGAHEVICSSAGKINKIRSDLMQKGISEEEFAKVHTPVGLDISANTPEEIAVAVMAEIISVKNTGKVISTAFDHEQLDAVLSDPGDPVLVTVIRKIMASPRDPGTKMIVTSDGKKWGTIGGGAAEHQALGIARDHLDDPEFITEIIRVGDEQKSADGMVCGGVIDVLFEKL